MPKTWISILTTVLFSLVAVMSFAQPSDNSPYSRFGLGDLVNQYFIAAGSMGGISSAYHDPYHLNLVNPASYGFLRSTAFEAGIFANLAKIEDQNTGNTTDVWSGNLSYLALGFPLKSPINLALDKKESPFSWGMGFSLVPFSTVGYDIEVTEERENIGEILYLFEGNGGTYRVSWTNAWKYKNLSFGLNLGYLFGKITNRHEVLFRDLDFSYQDAVDNDFNVNGLVYDVGLMYKLQFKEINEDGVKAPSGRSLTIGVHGNTNTSFTVRQDKLFRRLNAAYSTAQNLAVDTFENVASRKGNGTLPTDLGLGLFYDDGKSWKFGVDLATTLWSQYQNDAQINVTSDASEDQILLEDVWNFRAGLEWIPNPTSFKRYFNRARYRLGFRTGLDPRTVNDEQLQHFGVSFGVGLPIILKNEISFISLGFEIGEQGTDNALRETYYNISLGFTLNDNTWFFKRKFK